MATKLKVLLQRVEAKDYQDIAALIKAGVSLERGLAAARELYGHRFQPSESLKTLVSDPIANAAKGTGSRWRIRAAVDALFFRQPTC
jgi:hypothetical protein